MGTDSRVNPFFMDMEAMISKYMRPDAIRRGWDYSSRGKVAAVRMVGSKLAAVVSGSHDYMVMLGTRHDDCSCDCPVSGWCKHMAAVFFKGLQENGGDAERALERLTGGGPVTISRIGSNAEPSSSVRPSGQTSSPGEEASPEEWLEWMDRSYGETWHGCKHTLHPLQPVLSALKGSARDWPKPLQKLHWMASILFVLEQAERALRLADAFSRYYQEMSFTRMAEPWVDHFYALAGELEPSLMKGRQLEWLDFLTGLLRERGADTAGKLFRWDRLYYALAEKLHARDDWMERETDQLRSILSKARQAASDELLPEPGANDVRRPQDERGGADGDSRIYFPIIALAHLEAFRGHDRQAVDLLLQGPSDPAAGLALDTARKRLDSKDWGGLAIWMDYLSKTTDGKRGGSAIQPFLLLCRSADMEQSDNPIWMEYLVQKLPFSYMALSDQLLDKGSFEQWADLQLAMGLRPDELDPADVRSVAKLAPAMLIPLYHQSVESWIGIRNRQSYRMAVKQLKKLEKLYQAERNTEAWERYMARIALKYQRMRALQEELRKGSLLK